MTSRESTRLVLRGPSTSFCDSTAQVSSSTSSWTVAFSQWLCNSLEFQPPHLTCLRLPRRLPRAVALQDITVRTPIRVSITTQELALWVTVVRVLSIPLRLQRTLPSPRPQSCHPALHCRPQPRFQFRSHL